VCRKIVFGIDASSSTTSKSTPYAFSVHVPAGVLAAIAGTLGADGVSECDKSQSASVASALLNFLYNGTCEVPVPSGGSLINVFILKEASERLKIDEVPDLCLEVLNKDKLSLGDATKKKVELVALSSGVDATYKRRKTLLKLLANSKSDFISIKCVNEERNRRAVTVRVPKLILVAQCKYFESLFADPSRFVDSNTSVVVEETADAATVQRLVDYICLGKIGHISSIAQLARLHELSNRWMCNGLSDKFSFGCRHFLEITPRNLLQRLLFVATSGKLGLKLAADAAIIAVGLNTLWRAVPQWMFLDEY